MRSTLAALQSPSHAYAYYTSLGQPREAKKLLEWALEGYKKVVGLEQISAYVPALDIMKLDLYA